MRNVASGPYAVAITDESDTNFEQASITMKMSISAKKTFVSMMRNDATPTSTPLPPLKP